MGKAPRVEESWQGKHFSIIKPNILHGAAQEGPLEILTTSSLPDPIGSVAVRLSTLPEAEYPTFVHTANIALGGDIQSLKARWQTIIEAVAARKKHGGFVLGEGRHSTYLSIRDPMVLDLLASFEEEDERVVLSNNPTQIFCDELVQYIPATPEDANHQLLRFLQAASLVVDICASLRKPPLLPTVFHGFPGFPARRLRIDYRASGNHHRRLGFHERKQPVDPELAYTTREEPAATKAPSDLGMGSGSTERERRRPPKEPEDLIGTYQWPHNSLDDLYLAPDIAEAINTVRVLRGNTVIANEWGVPISSNRLLLWGPPGTGKTSIAHGLAEAHRAILWMVGPEDIYTKWLGESESAMKELFVQARSVTRPTVLLLDEFDSFFSDPDANSMRTENSVNGIIRRELLVFGQDNPNLMLVATSNTAPDDIDPAMTRDGRFDVRLRVPLPDKQSRLRIFSTCMYRFAQQSTAAGDAFEKQATLFEQDIDYKKLAQETDGMSGSTIYKIIKQILEQKAVEHAGTTTRPAPVSEQELLAAITARRIAG